MSKPIPPPIPPTAPATKPLAQQKTDFTAEGSPPPGKVGTDVPVGSPDENKGSSPAPPGKGRAAPAADADADSGSGSSAQSSAGQSSDATKVKSSVRQGTDPRSGRP